MNEGLVLLLRVFTELGLRHFAVGSIASSIHGIPRFTNYVDLLVEVDEKDARRIAELIGSQFYMDPDEAGRAIRAGRAFNILHLASASKIDVFPLSEDPFLQSELTRSAEVEWMISGADPIMLPVASAEDTVLYKLQWYELGGRVSDRQWGDVLGIAMRAGLDWNYLQHWASHLGVVSLLERLRAEVEPDENL